MKIIIFFLAVATVCGQSHHSCIHSNHQHLQADQVVSEVMVDINKNKDGIIQPNEIEGFIDTLDENKDGHVVEHEFVKEWHHRYHDVHEFAVYLFYHFDADVDHEVSIKDLMVLGSQISTDGDMEVSVAEMKAWIMHLYTTCVHIPHNGNLVG